MSSSKRKHSPIKLEDIYDRIVSLDDRIAKLDTKFDIQATRQDNADQKLINLESEFCKISDKQVKCDLRLNSLEQKYLNNLMEIKGVKDVDNLNAEECKNHVDKIMNEYKIKFNSNDIVSAYVKKINTKEKKSFCVIMVKFSCEEIKISVMKQKAANRKQHEEIFFEHALTPYNRALFNKARSVRNELNLPIVYYRDEKIMLKNKKEDKPIIVRSFEGLDKLLHNNKKGKNLPTTQGTQKNEVEITNEHHATSSQVRLSPDVSKQYFSILQLNVRGINELNKFNVFKSYVDALKILPDVIVLSEVKLKPTFPTDIYKLKNYYQISALRDAKNSKGGLLVYVNNDLSHSLTLSYSSSFELILLNVSKNNFNTSLICTYRPPDYLNFPLFIDELEKILNKIKGNVMIVGDINIDWLSTTYENVQYKCLLLSYEMEVTNTIRTRPISGKIIDHAATNFHLKTGIKNLTIDQDSWFTDHSAILSLIKITREKEKQSTVVRSKVHFDKLCDHFKITNISNIDDVDIVANEIDKAVKGVVNDCTTITKYKVKQPSKIGDHVNAELLDLIKIKDKLRKKLNKRSTTDIKIKYDKVCEDFKILNEKLYRNYLNEKLIGHDIGKTWKGLNEVLGRSKDDSGEVKKLITENGDIIDDPIGIANKFNYDFTTHDDLDQTKISNIFIEGNKLPNSFFLEPTDEIEIAHVIDSLKSNSAAGPDGISPKIIKKLKIPLTPLIMLLTNLIFSTGNFPTSYKEAIVRPIHKGGKKSETSNYRPISMLNVFAKIIEKLLYMRIYSFLDKKQYLYKSQYGFRKKSGTDNAAHELVSDIRNALDNGEKVSCVFIDLKKAFDLVHHDVLLKVTEAIGIRGMPLKLLKNYLYNRQQVVKVNGVSSDKREIKCGVIQGSVLGSLFFLIVINAISLLKLTGKIILYADDAVLLHTHSKEKNIESDLRLDMKTIINFFNERRMFMNVNKTVFMVFQSSACKARVPTEIIIDDTCTLGRTEYFKYLGLHLDPGLTFHIHAQKIENKISRAVGVLWKFGNKMPIDCRKLIYFSLIHSHLNFMIALWGTATNSTINPLQTLQNRAIRNVYRMDLSVKRIEIYKSTQILPIRALCFSRIAEFIHKCTNNLTLTALTFPQCGGRTRQKNSLHVKKSKNKFGRLNINCIGPKIYNKIPKEITSTCSTHSFKKKLKNFLLESSLTENLLSDKLMKNLFQ